MIERRHSVFEIWVKCPFNDCSVSLLWNQFEIVTDAECPQCHRLFCAQCNVPWHSGLNCQQFQRKQLKSHTHEALNSRSCIEECVEEEKNCRGKKKSATCLMDCPNQQRALELKAEENLIKSSIVGWKKSYCPFKDCSVLLVNDEKEVVTSAECPSCHRLFCEQCKVPWHGGINCEEFQRQQQKLKCSMNVPSYDEKKKKDKGKTDEKKKKDKGKAKVTEFETSNESYTESPEFSCGICCDFIIDSSIVRGSATCNHRFCASCISNHVAAQLSQNIIKVSCPNSCCFEQLKPNHLQYILPEEVVVRWAFARYFCAR